MKSTAAPQKEGPRINRDIRAREVQLIDAEGKNHGAIQLLEALAIAEAAGLDLVEIAPNSAPPVCKILDYGRFRFAEQKKAAEARKKQKVIHLKEIKFHPFIEEHDYMVKFHSLERFLKQGDKAKITLRVRGREMAHQEFGIKLLQRVQADLAELGVVEQFPKLEGRQMIMVIAPKKKN